MPLGEFDGDSDPLFDPMPAMTTGTVPRCAVVCFFQEVIEEVCGEGRADERT